VSRRERKQQEDKEKCSSLIVTRVQYRLRTETRLLVKFPERHSGWNGEICLDGVETITNGKLGRRWFSVLPITKKWKLLRNRERRQAKYVNQKQRCSLQPHVSQRNRERKRLKSDHVIDVALRLKILYTEQGGALLNAPDSSSWKEMVFYVGFPRLCSQLLELQ
jgi:hypothetical protein